MVRPMSGTRTSARTASTTRAQLPRVGATAGATTLGTAGPITLGTAGRNKPDTARPPGATHTPRATEARLTLAGLTIRTSGSRPVGSRSCEVTGVPVLRVSRQRACQPANIQGELAGCSTVHKLLILKHLRHLHQGSLPACHGVS